MTIHAMIDLETFGKGERAAIVQLGITAFDTHGTGGELPEGSSQEWNIDLVSSLAAGGVEDESTREWWSTQAKTTLDAVTAHPRYSIGHVMDNLGAFCRMYEPKRVWSHGATFDLAILGGYFYRAGLTTPWHYGDARDTRTLFELAEDLTGWRRPKRVTAHTARADAIAQAEDVQEAMAVLRGEMYTRTK